MNLDETTQIQHLCKYYDFTYKILGQNCYIKSKFHSWYFTHSSNSKRNYILYHENKKKCSGSYHRQRCFYDIPYMLKSIHEHDGFQIQQYDYSQTRMGKLFAKISKIG